MRLDSIVSFFVLRIIRSAPHLTTYTLVQYSGIHRGRMFHRLMSLYISSRSSWRSSSLILSAMDGISVFASSAVSQHNDPITLGSVARGPFFMAL